MSWCIAQTCLWPPDLVTTSALDCGTPFLEHLRSSFCCMRGVVVYLKSTVARDRVGSIGLWMLLLSLAIVELANVLGPPPPSVVAVAWSAQAMWLLVAWAYWVDRHRDAIA